MAELTPDCRLCGHHARDFIKVDETAYLACDHCGLRMMAAENLPSPTQEKAHYDWHQNDVNDHGYQQFLSRLSAPLLTRLRPASSLLDFGAGPGPALAAMMRNKGHDVAIYDPFYAPDPSVLEAKYDGVMATEVVEHFHHPRKEFDRMVSLLNPGGWLAVMTTLQDDDAAFATWYYRRDPTHVAFYREETFAHIAKAYGLRLWRPSRNVALFQHTE